MSVILQNMDSTLTQNEVSSCNVETLAIEIFEASRIPAALTEWKLLDRQLENRSVACSYPWVSTWLKHYGGLIPHRIVLGKRGETTVGICLLTEGVDQKNGPFSVKSLHLGTAGEPAADSVCVEYNKVLVEESSQAEFYQLLCEFIQSESQWDDLRLDGFSEKDSQQFVQYDANWTVRKVENHYYDLQAAREQDVEVISQFGYATRKNLRRNLKTFEELTTEWAETTDQAESIYADLVRLHQARWQAEGQPGVYASSRFEQFHRELICQLIPTQQMGLFRVTEGTEVIGCVQVFIDDNRALCYQGGSQPYEGKRSPGVIVDYLCIEECFRRGFDAYDFLAGDTHHKKKLSTTSGLLTWAENKRPRWKYRCLDLARSIKSTFRNSTSLDS
jgi:hypothetical protein